MKKLLFIFVGLMLTVTLTSCADFATIPSESTAYVETSAPTEASVDLYDPSVALFAFDGVSTPFEVYGGNKSETEGIAIIERERAVDIALAHVELTLDEVFDIEAELEYDYNGTFWEVEFQKELSEYSFYIDAESGNVVRNHVETDD